MALIFLALELGIIQCAQSSDRTHTVHTANNRWDLSEIQAPHSLGPIALLASIVVLQSHFPPRGSPLITALLTVMGSLIVFWTVYIWLRPTSALVVLCLSYPLWSWRQLKACFHQELARFHKARQARILDNGKARAQATLNSIGDGVITTDTRGLVTYMNPVAEKLTGYPVTEARGRMLSTVFNLAKEANREHVLCSQVGGFNRGTALHLTEEGILVSRAGQKIAIRASVAPLRNQYGETQGIVLAVSDISDTRRLARQMTYQATHDALTQLPNRSLLQNRLEHAIVNAHQSGRWVGVLFIDLDRFKTVNDGLGHTVGDNLLKKVADRLNVSVRQDDTVARIGGDEFVIVVENLQQEENVVVIAEKVLSKLNKPFWIGSHELLITGSMGISLFPRDGKNAETLIRNADMAMYRSKENGCNGIHLYSQDMNTRALEKLMMERDLRRALDREELELYYQPQVELENGRIIGFEALLRWRHPQHGMISPADFVPLAEETGLIIPIGDWVTTTACQQCKAWQEQSKVPLKIAVNLSSRQFTQGSMADRVAMALNESGLAPHHLDLEITESMIMRDVQIAIDHFRKLKAMGVSLSIDDFGTGYSSLNYLKQFPIDRLKIDKSFIRDITTNSEDAAITLAIISMAHNMNLGVIAEGVETEAQIKFLRSKRCNEMQGYYFSAPVPPQQVDSMLKANCLLHQPARNRLRGNSCDRDKISINHL